MKRVQIRRLTHNGEKGNESSRHDEYRIAAAVLFGAYKFGPAVVKGGAVAVAAVMIAKRIPYVNAVL